MWEVSADVWNICGPAFRPSVDIKKSRAAHAARLEVVLRTPADQNLTVTRAK
jgi:hypothetical protein